jgi:hypothetical protein
LSFQDRGIPKLELGNEGADHEQTRRYAIVSIDAAPVDVTPPDPSLTEVVAEPVAAE